MSNLTKYFSFHYIFILRMVRPNYNFQNTSNWDQWNKSYRFEHPDLLFIWKFDGFTIDIVGSCAHFKHFEYGKRKNGLFDQQPTENLPLFTNDEYRFIHNESTDRKWKKKNQWKPRTKKDGWVQLHTWFRFPTGDHFSVNCCQIFREPSTKIGTCLTHDCYRSIS